MKVSEVMSKKVVSASPDLPLRQAVSLMRRKHVKELPVVKKGKLVGLVTLYDVSMMPDYGGKATVKSVMFKAPALKPSSDVLEALRLISETGIQGLPVFQKTLVGFVSDYDLLKVYVDQFKGLVSSDLMKKVPLIKQDEAVGKATRLMDFHKLDSLPVVNKNRELVGVVSHDAVLEFFFIPHEGITRGEQGGKALNPLSSPVSGVVKKGYKTVLIDDKVTKAVKLMLRNHLTSVMVVNQFNKPVGLIDRKELVSHLYNKLTGWETYIHFSGLKLDYLTRDLLTKIIINHFERFDYLVTDLSKIDVYIKGVHDHAETHAFEIKVAVTQKGRTLRVKKTGYSLRETLDDALSDLERMLAKTFRKKEV